MPLPIANVDMPEVTLIKSPAGSLVPFSEEDVDKLRKIKTGAPVRCDIAQMRNPLFHRKFFSLIKFLFDIWSETIPRQAYKGVDVMPSMERFRKDLIILTGRYEASYNIRGEVRLEAASIAFSKMSQEEFEKLFSDVINVALKKVIDAPDLDEHRVRHLVEQLMAYD